MKDINPNDLICMNDFEASHPVRIDLVYAQASHSENMFKQVIYRADAKFWLHKDLASVTLRATEILYEEKGWTLLLKDGLRTTDAQALIIETDICKAHPEWFEAPRLFSPPGAGGHPRGMAVDVDAIDANGELVDFGTVFDFLPEDRWAANPSARDYTEFPQSVLDNRKSLEQVFLRAGDELDTEIIPLGGEWWDFRLPREVYERYAPLSDMDLLEHMRMAISSKD